MNYRYEFCLKTIVFRSVPGISKENNAGHGARLDHELPDSLYTILISLQMPFAIFIYYETNE